MGNRTGHLFQGRYKAILVDKKIYLLELSRYVVLNPVRAKGMVRELEDWPWSSYLTMINKVEAFSWLTTDWVLSQFGGSPAQAQNGNRQFVLDRIGQKIEIWSELKNQIYLGDEVLYQRYNGELKKTEKRETSQRNNGER